MNVLFPVRYSKSCLPGKRHFLASFTNSDKHTAVGLPMRQGLVTTGLSAVLPTAGTQLN